MSDASDKAPEPPATIDKLNEPNELSKTTKRNPWWLRSTLWFALGMFMTTVVMVVAYKSPLPFPLLSIDFFYSFILNGAGVAAISALPFSAWAGFRAKNAINWKAYGFLLPFACGISYPFFIVAIFVSYSQGGTAGFIVRFFVCVAFLLVLAEFCVRLQPPKGRWYQYSLRALLLFMLFTGVLFGLLGKIIREENRKRVIVNWIEDNGGLVYDPYPLSYFSNVKGVDLQGTQVSDLSQLEDLSNLKELDLRDTPVSKEEVRKLQKVLPDCKILWDSK